MTSWLLVAVIALGVFFLFKNIVHAKDKKTRERVFIYFTCAGSSIWLFIFFIR